MIYTKEKKIFVKGTASAVTNNVTVNMSKCQKPPHGFAVIDRQTVVLVMDVEDPMEAVRRLDTKTDVTQVR